MKQRRVVITGMGAITPFGEGVECLWGNLLSGNSAVKNFPEMGKICGLRSQVAATVPEVDVSRIDRKKRRFMSAMSIFSTISTMEAIASAGLDESQVSSVMTGLSLASTTGSSAESEEFFRQMSKYNDIERIMSTSFFKTMNHSCAANTAQALGIRGRFLAPSAACASGTLSIGLAYEAISMGMQDVMICGGADEHHVLATVVFDIMNAASWQYNDCPEKTPRPFDSKRDGVVCSEGAGILVLECLEHALARNARILGEIVGFSTLSAPGHIANPDVDTMVDCMELAMRQGGIVPDEIDYVSAHATATEQGDVAESQAIARAMGEQVQVSSLKGHIGHTMAASGALELVATLIMMRENKLIPTHNLEDVDPECGRLNYTREVCSQQIDVVLKNSFALGGVNCTLVVRKY